MKVAFVNASVDVAAARCAIVTHVSGHGAFRGNTSLSYG